MENYYFAAVVNFTGLDNKQEFASETAEFELKQPKNH